MMKYRVAFTASILLISSVSHSAEKEPQPAADIKPKLSNEGFDEEQMRLTRIIHKRIVDYHQIKKKTKNLTALPFETYKETLKSGAQFEMLPVKAGSFKWKGSAPDDVIEVTLSPFWMGKTEVTWEEYEPFMLSKIPRQKDGQVLDFIKEQLKNDIDFLARPTPPYHPMTYGMARDGHPAISMTQHAANKYCQWISFQTGHFYRLPTEAEWEYACRAGSDKMFSWGDDTKSAAEYAWFSKDAGSQYKKPATKKPNPWGFYDMHGNVLEWTLDQHVTNRRAYFAKDKVRDPWIKATKPYPHVTKGGHWKQDIEQAAAGARRPSSSKWKVSDPNIPKSLWYHTDTPWLGMRVVRPKKIPTVEEMYHYWNSGVAEEE